MSKTNEWEYIGDGVYVLHDGHGIWLHANDHEHPTDRIYLEPSVYEALVRFSTHADSWIAAQRAKADTEKVCTK